jgi:hypothetical protein
LFFIFVYVPLFWRDFDEFLRKIIIYKGIVAYFFAFVKTVGVLPLLYKEGI